MAHTLQSYLKKNLTHGRFKFGFPLFTKPRRLALPTVTLLIIDCVDYERARRALDHCRFYCDFAEVKLLTHFEIDDPLVVKIAPLRSIEAYSEFLLKQVTDYFRTEHVLIAQWDGFVFNPRYWTPEFLRYDYIGAPWPVHLIANPEHKEYLVGNGGFSLRSKRLQDFLKQDPAIQAIDSEDVVICQYQRARLEQAGFHFAPVELARQFACEVNLTRSFGQHGRVGVNMPLHPLWLRLYNLLHYGRFVRQVL